MSSKVGERAGRANGTASAPGNPTPPARGPSPGALHWIKVVCLAVAVFAGTTGAQWLLFRRHALGRLEHPRILASTPFLVAGAFSPDGRSLVALTPDAHLRRLSVPDLDVEDDVSLGNGQVLRGARFYAAGSVFIPSWAPSPARLWRQLHPVTPPLAWLDAFLYHDARADRLTLRDSRTGKLLGVLDQSRDLLRLDVSPDGIYLAGIPREEGATAEKGGHQIQIWDQRGRLKGIFHSKQPVLAVAFSPTESIMAWLHPKKSGMEVSLRDMVSGKRIQSLEATLARGALLRFSPDGTRLAVGSKTMELWDWKWERRILAYMARPPLDDVVFSRDRKRLLLVTTEMAGEKSWRILDVDAGRPGPPMTGSWLSPDWKTVARLVKGNLEVRDAPTDRLLRRRIPRREEAVLGFSQNGGRFATAEDPGVVQVWDLANDRIMQTIRGPHGRVLALNHDWTTAVSNCGPRFVVWSLASGEELRRFSPADVNGWDFVQLTPDQRQLLFIRRSFDGPATAVTFDPADGGLLQVLEPWTDVALDNTVCETAGDVVVASTGEQWQAYSDKDRQQLWERRAPERAIRILADAKGANFYFVGHSHVYVVKPATGEITFTIAHDGVPGEPNAHLAALTPDGALLATAESEATCDIAVWQPESGKRLATLRGNTRPVCDMAFSQDGESLLSLGGDGHLMLWRLHLPKEKK